MLFPTYWELNEDMPGPERLEAAQKIIASGIFPPEGVNVIRWDSTPDLWGIVVMEADTMKQVVQAIGVWREAAPGFFKVTRTAPAAPVEEVLSMVGELQAKLGAQ